MAKYRICRVALASTRYTRDDLSRQGGIRISVTGLVVQLNILGVTGNRKETTPAHWRTAFIKRVKRARETAQPPLSREELVERLVAKIGKEVNLERYKRYETRALLPHHWIIPFCEITAMDPWELLSGRPFDLRQTLQAAASRRVA